MSKCTSCAYSVSMCKCRRLRRRQQLPQRLLRKANQLLKRKARHQQLPR